MPAMPGAPGAPTAPTAAPTASAAAPTAPTAPAAPTRPTPNAQQLEAIETLDGPVLVVAGPGTGKTQLLTLRVANILEKRDVGPQNILCLTFTDAGAQAMSKRLASFIGKSAYEVRINTFHAFSSYLKDRYITYFDRSPFDTLITDLQSRLLISSLLNNLAVTDPLFQRSQVEGVPGQLGNMTALIGKIKKSGLTTDELRQMAQQSLDTMDYLRDHTDLIRRMCAGMPTKKDDKAQFCDELKAASIQICQSLPAKLQKRMVSLPGSYDPYALWLAQLFEQTEWYEGEGSKTTGFQKLRDSLFDKKAFDFKAREVRGRYRTMLSALDVFDQYQASIKARGLYDYDDMILDGLDALERHEDLRALLASQYQYILVDEFQDTNGSQMHLLELLTQGALQPNIMAVGDDDQAIMRFQGASVAFLKQFEQRYPGTRRIVLTTNYRSTPSLVDLGQKVATQIQGRLPASDTQKLLVAHGREDAPTQFTIRTYASCQLQYYDVARAIRQRMDEGFIQNAKNPQEAIAVIAWKHSSLLALIPYLKMFNIDYTYDTLTTVTTSEVLQGFLACIQYVAHLSTGDVARADPWLAQVIAAPELGIPYQTYVPFALAAKANLQEHRSSWTDTLRSTTEDTSPELKQLWDWLSQAAKLAAAAGALTSLHFLAKPFIAYYQGQTEVDPFGVMEFNYGLSALLDFVGSEIEGGSGGGGGSVLSGSASSARGVSGAPGAGAVAGDGGFPGDSRGGLTGGLPGVSRHLMLGDVCGLLDEASRFGVKMNITVPVSRPQAVALKSAHGSKGLEYDLVYLIDADQDSWHGQGGRGDISCPNIYLNESRDDDDMRRLLFVALTRARLELEMSLGRSEPVAELVEHVQALPVELSHEQIGLQSAAVWEQGYYPDDQSLRDLIHGVLAKRKMSASLLNGFVRYRPGEPQDGRAFVIDRVFDFPQAPVAAFEFGTLVHRYLELYLTHVRQAGDVDADTLLGRMHEAIDRLDLNTVEAGHLHQRLDLVVKIFVPQMDDYIGKAAREGGAHGEALGGLALSEQWLNAEVDGVPLVGKSDLLIIDQQDGSIQVCDYKTGSPSYLSDDYWRQLVFYKLLIEEGGQWPGCRVCGGMDIFVEPDAKTGQLRPAKIAQVPDADVSHVRKLIQAVYWRIQNACFDTSGFNPPEGAKKKDVQRAYELWLIADHKARTANQADGQDG